MTVHHLEDFRAGDVHELGSRSIDKADIVGFARVYDPQRHHLNGAIASGWHVAGLFMSLYVEAVLRETAVEVSPGVDELRWLRPVRPGDTLTGRVTVLDVGGSLSRPDCGIVRKQGRLVDDQNRPVMQLILYALIRRRVRFPV